MTGYIFYSFNSFIYGGLPYRSSSPIAIAKLGAFINKNVNKCIRQLLPFIGKHVWIKKDKLRYKVCNIFFLSGCISFNTHIFLNIAIAAENSAIVKIIVYSRIYLHSLLN